MIIMLKWLTWQMSICPKAKIFLLFVSPIVNICLCSSSETPFDYGRFEKEKRKRKNKQNKTKQKHSRPYLLKNK